MPEPKIPNGSSAVVSRSKLTDYLLSDGHPVGRYKANFFRALGYSRDDPEALEKDLLAVLENELIGTQSNEFGTKYVVAGRIGRRDAEQKPVVTVWIILSGSDTPRFVTAYPGDEPND